MFITDLKAHIFVFFFLGAFSLSSQKYFGLSVDNDLYFRSDYYYSSGVFLEYGIGKEKLKEDGSADGQIINSWTLGQEINNPSNRYTSGLSRIDYPYNGWLFAQYRYQHYKTPFNGKGWGGQIGVTGDASLAKQFQNLYHNHVLSLASLSWAYQQPQALHINAFGELLRSIEVHPHVQFTTHLFSMLGTFRSTTLGRFGFQIGNASGLPFRGNPFNTSPKEWAFYFGMKLEYRFHDYAISGNLFQDNSNTWESVPFKNALEVGATVTLQKWRLQSVFYYTSKDVATQRRSFHRYLNISVFKLF